MGNVAKYLTMVILLALPLAVNAGWTGEFRPTGPYVSGAGNYHFRVMGVPPAANCRNGFAYIAEADSGAKGKMAALLLAYGTGKNVDLFVETDSQGYCMIIEFAVR